MSRESFDKNNGNFFNHLRKKSFQKVGEILPDLLKPAFVGKKSEFFILNNLAKNWSDIVGSRHCKSCHIKKIQLQKADLENNPQNAKPLLKITIAAFDSATAFSIKNETLLIVNRINSLYGAKQIIKISVILEPKFDQNLFSEFPTKIEGKEKIDPDHYLSIKNREKLQENISQIKNPNLVDILCKLTGSKLNE